MGRVVGIGGVFIRARDADALRRWYAEVLGFEIDGDNGAVFHRPVSGSGLAFSIFPSTSTYIGAPDRQMAMVNFLVDDLDGFVQRVAGLGVDVEPIQDEPYGKFAWLTDPESNRIELWQPPATEPD